MENKKELLKEYFNSVQDENVKKFMEQCIETIPEYWFTVPASSTGKYHPNYALGNGGLMRHTIALLRFFDRLVHNSMYGSPFTNREMDLMRVACLMHDSRKSGSDEDYAVNKYTRFEHPILAANVVRAIETEFITDEEKEIIANAIESHMGQWNVDTYGKSKVELPLPTNKYQKLVHLVDYLAAQKGVEVLFENFIAEPHPTEDLNKVETVDTYVFQFGKYKGMKLTEVKEQHPDYIDWAKDNIDREPLATLLKQI